MTENTMKKTSDTTAADLPPAPNGNGASNGTRQADAAEGSAKDTPSSKKNKNKKKRHQHNQKPASAQAASVGEAPGGPASPTTAHQTPPTEPTEPTVADDPQPLFEQSAAPQIEEVVAAPIEPPPAPIIEQPAASLRLRMKLWTDPTTAKRYLMPSAFMRDVMNGQPVSDIMYAYAMRDDDTKLVTLTAAEWNALPFFYFQEDGPAPRATTRPVDVIG